MIKLIWMLVRKPGITHEQFRDHYENVHSKLGKQYVGHLLCGYVRNYPSDVRRTAEDDRGPADFKYDCIAEWHVPDEAALAEVWRVLQDPAVRAVFRADEPNFVDLSQGLLITCREGSVVEDGTTLTSGQALPLVD